jgi:hypothetical protein
MPGKILYMACIVCGSNSGNEYCCSIKEMTVCFCDEHFENKEYDCVIVKQRPVPVPVAVK